MTGMQQKLQFIWLDSEAGLQQLAPDDLIGVCNPAFLMTAVGSRALASWALGWALVAHAS